MSTPPKCRPCVLALIVLALMPSLRALAQTNPSVFSHKKHAPLRLPCSTCHVPEGKGTLMSYPGQQQCKVCHTEIAAASTAFPTTRVYRVPDFVFFSHKRHLDAKAECTKCHGDVTASDAVTLAVPPKMKFCVDCHKETNAKVDCFVCHELGQ